MPGKECDMTLFIRFLLELELDFEALKAWQMTPQVRRIPTCERFMLRSGFANFSRLRQLQNQQQHVIRGLYLIEMRCADNSPKFFLGNSFSFELHRALKLEVLE
jgi:hypothetical protein